MTTMTSTQPFQPDWVSPPGDTIGDALEELRMSQADLALRTGFTRKHVNRLVKGNVAITAEAAVRLEAVLGEPASFWLSREAQYRACPPRGPGRGDGKSGVAPRAAGGLDAKTRLDQRSRAQGRGGQRVSPVLRCRVRSGVARHLL